MEINEENLNAANKKKVRLFLISMGIMCVLLVAGIFALTSRFPVSTNSTAEPATNVETYQDVVIVNPADDLKALTEITALSIEEAEATNVLENRAPSSNGKISLTTQSANLYNPKGESVCVYVGSGEACPESKPYIYLVDKLLKLDDTSVLMTEEGVYLLENPTEDIAIIVSSDNGKIASVAVVNKASSYFRSSTGLYSQAQIANLVYNADQATIDTIVNYAAGKQ